MYGRYAIPVLCLLVFLLMPVPVFAGPFDGKTGDNDATGDVIIINHSPATVTIRYATENGPLWLAWSTRRGTGRWKDYEPVQVEGMGDRTVIIEPDPGLKNTVRVSLWRYKVRDRDNPMGFVMEHRIAMDER